MGPAYSRSLETTNKREVAGLQLLQKTHKKHKDIGVYLFCGTGDARRLE